MRLEGQTCSKAAHATCPHTLKCSCICIRLLPISWGKPQAVTSWTALPHPAQHGLTLPPLPPRLATHGSCAARPMLYMSQSEGRSVSILPKNTSSSCRGLAYQMAADHSSAPARSPAGTAQQTQRSSDAGPNVLECGEQPTGMQPFHKQDQAGGCIRAARPRRTHAMPCVCPQQQQPSATH